MHFYNNHEHDINHDAVRFMDKGQPTRMIIGVISDIHGHLSTRATEALRGCDYILCAGDTESPFIIHELQAIAPTIAILGNCDHRDFGPSVTSVASPLLGGVRFKIVHRPEDIGQLPEDVQVVIHGHTHVPRNQVLDGIRFINPGSPTRPRGGSKKSIAKLTIENARITSVDFISVDLD